MPVYLYEHICVPDTNDCKNDHEFEVTQKITDRALDDCNYCGRKVRRLIAGSIGIKWKGGAPTPKHYSK
jgi:putative FmdB family regulatory protein